MNASMRREKKKVVVVMAVEVWSEAPCTTNVTVVDDIAAAKRLIAEEYDVVFGTFQRSAFVVPVVQDGSEQPKYRFATEDENNTEYPRGTLSVEIAVAADKRSEAGR